MDFLEFLLALSAILVIGIVGYGYGYLRRAAACNSTQRDAIVLTPEQMREQRKIMIEDRKLAELDLVAADKEAKRVDAIARAEASKAAHRAVGKEPAPWVKELLASFGVDPNVLFEDAMPPELQKILPFVKGFLESGGLERMLGSAPGAQPGPGPGNHHGREEEL